MSEAINLDDAAYCYGVVLTSTEDWLHELVYLISRCASGWDDGFSGNHDG